MTVIGKWRGSRIAIWRAHESRKTIPDRHSEDLFGGGRVEGFERQSAFRNRDKRPTQRAQLPI